MLSNSGCPFTTDKRHASWVSLPRYFKQHGYTTVGTGKIFHPGVCDGLAAGEDKHAWSRYYHASGPNSHGPSGSCANGAYVNGTCASGKERTLSWVSNESLRLEPGGGPHSDGTPDSMVAAYATTQLHKFSKQRRVLNPAATPPPPPFFLAVGLHK